MQGSAAHATAYAYYTDFRLPGKAHTSLQTVADVRGINRTMPRTGS